MVKKVVILGSTGSIGRNALRVIEALNSSGDNGFAGGAGEEVQATVYRDNEPR
ncbi:MAG: hypothetical protein ACYS9V_07360 [Planctomycetota bacterium]